MWWFLIRLNLAVVTHEFEIAFVDLVFNIFFFVYETMEIEQSADNYL